MSLQQWLDQVGIELFIALCVLILIATPLGFAVLALAPDEKAASQSAPVSALAEDHISSEMQSDAFVTEMGLRTEAR